MPPIAAHSLLDGLAPARPGAPAGGIPAVAVLQRRARGDDRVLRAAVVAFLGRLNFCLAAVERSSIHLVVPGGRIIPFDTCNLPCRPARLDRGVGGAP